MLPHGEHGCIARLLTPGHGLLAGYVRGGRGRRLGPVLQRGNAVAAAFRARVEEQLPALTVELVRSRALLALDPMGSVALEWLTGLVAAVLPEAQPYATVHAEIADLLDRMAGPEPLAWAAALARFELSFLAEMGFGLDLSACAATGEPAATADLTHVSPRSGGAVSAIAAAPYAAKLLPLPAFLLARAEPTWPGVADALRLTAFFLDRNVLDQRARNLLPTRERLAVLVQRRGAAGTPG